MNKLMISIATVSVLSLSFNGCANNNLSVPAPKVENEKEFKKGVVTSTTKVLINDRKMAALTGAGIGVISGSVVKNKDNTIEGAIVGGLVGGLIGVVVGKEVEAYKTTIDNKFIAYLKKQLPNSTKVEYIKVGSEINNVNVLEDINDDTLVDAIDKRYRKNNMWFYHLSKYNITVKSPKKYYYLNDLVSVSFNDEYMIVDIKKLKSGVIKSKPKVITKVVTKIVEKPVIKEKVVYRYRVSDEIAERVVDNEDPEAKTTTVTTNKPDGFWE